MTSPPLDQQADEMDLNLTVRSLATLGMLLCLANQLQAGTVTYDFSGHLASFPLADHGPIVPGSPFNGQFTVDLSAPGYMNPYLPERTSYDQLMPPASFYLTIAGLTIRGEGTAIASIESDNFFSMFVQCVSVPGPGWTFTPVGGNAPNMEFNFGFLSDTLTDLAHLPDIERASLPTSVKSGSLSLGSGNYTYPGGSFTIPGDEELHFSFTTVTLVPEPGSQTLVAACVVCLLSFAARTDWVARHFVRRPNCRS